MKGRILITSIIVLLSTLALINIESKGITAGERSTTAMQVQIASPEPQAAAAPSAPQVDRLGVHQVEANQLPGQTAATPPVVTKQGLSPAAPNPPTETKETTNPTPAPSPAVPTNDEPQKAQESKVQTEATTTTPKSTPNKETNKALKVQPPSPVKNTSAGAQQNEMLGYINAARAQANLPALTLDGRLSNGAYDKSLDMAVNGYFSHTSPTYGSPFDMMKSYGITYQAAAENIARNSSVLAAHNAFMNSSGHRANILNPAFNKIGLGFYQKGSDLFVTQWFTN